MALSIGDRIKWCATPRGSLVKMGDSVAWCRGEHGSWVNLFGDWIRDLITILPWSRDYEDDVVVVALDVPADATADSLRELTERFEVREAWEDVLDGMNNIARADNRAVVMYFDDPGRDARAFFDRLHAAGWRPGMTAEDAARLLAEKC